MYLVFAKKSFQQNYIYRANTILRIVLSFLYLFIRISIWIALYSNKGVVDNISLKEMLTYILVAQFISQITYLDICGYVANRVKSGLIAIDFIRPINLKLCAISDSLGTVFFNIIFVTIPMLIVGTLIWGFILPNTVFIWISFIISIFFAMLLESTIQYIMGLTAFWTKTDSHINWIMGSFMMLFSGYSIPLWFYPKAFKMIADMLPFKYLVFEPINIFLGKTTQAETINILLMQITWIIVLFIVERIVWHYAKRIVTVQGG